MGDFGEVPRQTTFRRVFGMIMLPNRDQRIGRRTFRPADRDPQPPSEPTVPDPTTSRTATGRSLLRLAWQTLFPQVASVGWVPATVPDGDSQRITASARGDRGWQAGVL